MLIPPKYTLRPKISQLLASIQASKEVIDAISLPYEIELDLRRQSLLKSSLFSARIEGNTLTLEEVSQKSSKDHRKIEVANILKALNTIHQKTSGKITPKDILSLHKIVMDNLADHPGRFRSEASAIFNSAGIPVYVPPPPNHIAQLLNLLLEFASSKQESSVPIRASLTHYTFEKIHPFLDGNGRIGRLTMQMVLHIGGFDMKGLAPTEEYLDANRRSYYQSLDEHQNDVTGYLEFMLTAIAETAGETKKLLLAKKEFKKEDYLLPRRAEIYRIIKDHKLISFDQVKRRFTKINDRTLRYDLKKLADGNFIRKRGATKGVYYEAIET